MPSPSTIADLLQKVAPLIQQLPASARTELGDMLANVGSLPIQMPGQPVTAQQALIDGTNVIMPVKVDGPMLMPEGVKFVVVSSPVSVCTVMYAPCVSAKGKERLIYIALYKYTPESAHYMPWALPNEVVVDYRQANSLQGIFRDIRENSRMLGFDYVKFPRMGVDVSEGVERVMTQGIKDLAGVHNSNIVTFPSYEESPVWMPTLATTMGNTFRTDKVRDDLYMLRVEI